MAKRNKTKKRSANAPQERETTAEELKEMIIKEAIELAWLRVTNINRLRMLALAYENRLKENVNRCNGENEKVESDNE